MTQHEASTEERIAALEARIIELETLLDATQDLSEECRTHICDYYRYYLGGGPAEMSHTGYHAAITRYAELADEIERWCGVHPGQPEPAYLVRQAESLERRLRA